VTARGRGAAALRPGGRGFRGDRAAGSHPRHRRADPAAASQKP